jgi:hypothetical protein
MVPLVGGVYLTPMVQEAPGARVVVPATHGVPDAGASVANIPAAGPAVLATVKLWTVVGPPPVLVTVATPCFTVRSAIAVVSAGTGTETATVVAPVPLNCQVKDARGGSFVVIFSIPPWKPEEVGLNAMEIVQLAPGAIVTTAAPQSVPSAAPLTN